MIRRYTAEGHKFRLCVSLNAAIPEKRAALMPVERGQPARRAGGRGAGARRGARPGHARVRDDGRRQRRARRTPRRWGGCCAGIPVRLNPIAVNDATGRFRPPTEAEWNAFRDALARHLPGQPIVRRYSGGQDQHAACGMLGLAQARVASVGAGAGAAARRWRRRLRRGAAASARLAVSSGTSSSSRSSRSRLLQQLEVAQQLRVARLARLGRRRRRGRGRGGAGRRRRRRERRGRRARRSWRAQVDAQHRLADHLPARRRSRLA